MGEDIQFTIWNKINLCGLRYTEDQRKTRSKRFSTEKFLVLVLFIHQRSLSMTSTGPLFVVLWYWEKKRDVMPGNIFLLTLHELTWSLHTALTGWLVVHFYLYLTFSISFPSLRRDFWAPFFSYLDLAFSLQLTLSSMRLFAGWFYRVQCFKTWGVRIPPLESNSTTIIRILVASLTSCECSSRKRIVVNHQ